MFLLSRNSFLLKIIPNTSCTIGSQARISKICEITSIYIDLGATSQNGPCLFDCFEADGSREDLSDNDQQFLPVEIDNGSCDYLDLDPC